MSIEKPKTSKRTVMGNALKVVYINDLRVDLRYQRDKNKTAIRRIGKDFIPEAMGVPVVGEREDGSLWIVDGQQRIEYLKGEGKTQVRCEVFASKGVEHEAAVFTRINKNRTGLKPLQVFQAALIEGDETAHKIKDLVEEYDFKIPKSGSRSTGLSPELDASHITCVNALELIYSRGGDNALKFCLGIIKACWPNDVIKTRDIILSGLYHFWSNREGIVDLDRLLPRLNTTNPNAMIYTAGQMTGSARTANMAIVIERLYQKRSVKKK